MCSYSYLALPSPSSSELATVWMLESTLSSVSLDGFRSGAWRVRALASDRSWWLERDSDPIEAWSLASVRLEVRRTTARRDDPEDRVRAGGCRVRAAPSSRLGIARLEDCRTAVRLSGPLSSSRLDGATRQDECRAGARRTGSSWFVSPRQEECRATVRLGGPSASVLSEGACPRQDERRCSFGEAITRSCCLSS